MRLPQSLEQLLFREDNASDKLHLGSCPGARRQLALAQRPNIGERIPLALGFREHGDEYESPPGTGPHYIFRREVLPEER